MLVSLGCETLVLVAHALLHVSKLMATITALSQKCFDYFFFWCSANPLRPAFGER
jgi:hypothetical protein